MNKEQAEKYAGGFTWKSLLGIVYSSVVLMPAVIFTTLTSGVSVGGVVGYVVAFLVIEIARLASTRISKQEVFIIWSQSSTVASDIIFLALLQNLHFRSISSTTWGFKTYLGVPLPLAIPDWWAPPPNSSVIVSRTFFNQDWIMPIFTTLVGWILSGKVMDLMTGLLFYQIYVQEENLPFPVQVITAETISTLEERQPRKMGILTISSLIGFGYNIILYAVPFITSFKLYIIPIPWVEFTSALEHVYPSLSFGISTDLLILTTGFIMPFTVVVSMFIGAFAFYCIGNPILANLKIFDWKTGMNLSTIWQRSLLAFWAFPIMGLAVAAAVIPLIRHPRYILNAFKSLSRISTASKQKGLLPLWFILLAYFVAGAGIISLTAILTSFPLWIIILLVYGWSFLSSMMAARAIGESGIQVSIPYVTQTVILSNGYKGVDVWFAPTGSTGGGAWWASWFKVADLMKTNFISFIKAHFLASIPLAVIFSLIYVSLFWAISPIPSPLYPAVDIYWNANIITQSLWITGAVGLSGSFLTIISSFIAGAVASVVLEFVKIPFSLIGFFVGASSPIPTSTTALFGGVLGIVLRKFYGRKWFDEARPTIGAGLFLGSSVAIVIGIALAMAVRGGWALPY